MADATQITFYGLWGLAGRTVTAWVIGLDCGDYSVSPAGTIQVPFGSDPDGLMTIANIQAVNGEGQDWGPLATQIDIYLDADSSIHTYTVPAAVGFTFTSQGQLPRPASEGEIKSSTGSGLAKPRQINQIGALMNGAIGVSFGVSLQELTPAIFTDSAGTKLNYASMFSGVHQMPIIPDRGKYDCEICWQISRPYPCTIVAITGFLHTEEPG